MIIGASLASVSSFTIRCCTAMGLLTIVFRYIKLISSIPKSDHKFTQKNSLEIRSPILGAVGGEQLEGTVQYRRY